MAPPEVLFRSARGSARMHATTSGSALKRRIALVVLVSGAFAVLQIQQSLDQGQLAYPISYDDTTYFAEGLSRLHAVYDRGWCALLKGWWAQPPHSPWSTMVAFLGFALFGVHPWAPAAAASGAMIVMLSGVAVVTRSLTLPGVVAVTTALLTWPYFGHWIVDSRPDMMWGAALAAYCAVVSRSASRDLTPASTVISGLLLAVALLAKTSTFPVTLFVAGTAVATSAIGRRAGSLPMMPSLKRALIGAGIGAAIAAPHYLRAAPDIAGYIYENVFGDRAHVWNLALSAREHALYHLTGTGGTAMLGAWLWLTLATLLVFAGVVWYRRDSEMARRAICYGLSVVAAFAAVTIPAHKSPHIGAVFPALLAVGWLVMIVYVVNYMQTRAASGVPGVTMLVLFAVAGLGAFRWHSTIRYGVPDSGRFSDIARRHEDIDALFDGLIRSDLTVGNVFVDASSPFINRDLLRYYALTRRLDGIEFHDDLFAPDDANAATMIRDADAVVAFTPDNPDVQQFLPSSDPKRLGHLLEIVESEPRLHVAAVVKAAGRQGETRLYVRRPAFDLDANVRGFGPVEGPYPQWSLPRVRWGLGPGSKFVVPSQSHAVNLVIEAQTPHAGQVMTIAIDGVERFRHTFQRADAPERIIVPLPQTPNARWDVELKYSWWTAGSESDARKMAVLFRSIRWE
jgi:hypothetical protein